MGGRSGLMTGLHLYRGNRLEDLAAALAGVLEKPLAAPLQPEIVIVQSLGMHRWLALDLAQRLGISMNIEFPFPAGFLETLFTSLLGAEPKSAVFARDVLPWRVLAVLPALLDTPEFSDLRRYVEGPNRALKQFQLAGRIASVYDRALAWRPQLLREWDRGRDTSWQALLWSAVSRGSRAAHLTARSAAALRELGRADTPLEDFPERVILFGVSSLPPLFLELFASLSRRLEVHAFFLTPTPEFWSDLRSPREQRSIHRRQKNRELTLFDLHLETGNALLASFGRIGREFSELVADLEPAAEHDISVPPPEDTLLHRVQADVFQVCEGSAAQPLAPGDRSIQVHCCHSAMRELEVLHDQLLDLFARHPSLEPRHVLVTMPDVETYAPYIEAVFGAPESDRVRFPYSIADRSARAENGLADDFLRLLDLAGSRFLASSVLGLLDSASIRRRFELTERDVERVRSWMDGVGIRWGVDAAHRVELGLPEFSENTWRAGLQRLLLGYALPGDGGTLCEGILPWPGIEGEATGTLSRFLDFSDRLFEDVRDLLRARTVPEWERTLRLLLGAFFAEDDEFADELRRMRRAFESLGATAVMAGLEAPVEFAVLRAHLGAAFADTESGVGFLAGAITFCALKPMRSIPFRVLCMIGMNDGAFPRSDTPLAFDIVAQTRQLGDRTLRDDDRYLFLETLLSARETLYISYAGLSPRDHSHTPPSVAVGELLDYLETHHRIAPADFVTRHPLQPFSPAYFRGDEVLFSYSQENHDAAARGVAPRLQPRGFAGEPLVVPGPEWREVDADRLIEFFANASRFFVQDRLALQLPRERGILDDREPIELDALERYELRTEITRHVRDGIAPDDAVPVLRAAGKLPPGEAGRSVYGQLRGVSELLVARVAPYLASEPLPPLALDLRVAEWHVTGTLRELRKDVQLRFRASDVKPRDQLRGWIAHVLLNAAAPVDHPRLTVLCGTKKIRVFQPLENARAILADLLALYGEGLRNPLPLFPESSFAFANAERNSRKLGNPRHAAQQAWRADFGGRPDECDDTWIDYCFHHAANPLDARWEEVARRVFGPLLEHSSEPSAE
jgi:exodeoxyribonuclease V gamma subunit